MKLVALIGAAALSLMAAGVSHAQEETTIRLVEADSFSAEDLVQMIAYAKAGERGVKIESMALKADDIAFQAVLNGQADMGIGDSYEAISNLKAPVRNISQIRKLAYIPVVDKTVYPDWKSLDGQPFAVHSRGSGTETMARIVEKAEGIKFSEISYVPGAEVRVVAMQRGNIKATYLDLTTTKILIDSDPEKFARLPAGSQDASDSTLYVNESFAKENPKAVQILVEELLKSAKATAADPSYPAREREALGLLPDLSEKEVAEITPYFTEAVAAGIFPTDGGGEAAAKADVDFLAEAGKMPTSDKVSLTDYWDFAPLAAATGAIGQ